MSLVGKRVSVGQLLVLLTFSWLCAPAAHAFNFSVSDLAGETSTKPTSLQFGPDDRLYVAQQNGLIKVYTVVRNGPSDYAVTATETISVVKSLPNFNDDGAYNPSETERQVTGLLVTGSAANPVLYVTSSDPRIGAGGSGFDLNLDTNSGVLSRLTWTGTVWDDVQLVRGLPRSEENHASNGMQLDPVSNTLYIAQGGNTNAGGASNNFAFSTEYALSAAILSVDLDAIEALPAQIDVFGNAFKYDLPTLDDPNPNRTDVSPGVDENDPFGGHDGLNQAKLVVGGPVQVYASGFRNAYDLLITQLPGKSGRMYTWDNGANAGWGGYPTNEGPGGTCTNEYQSGEPGVVNNLDNFHYITGPGYYGGHPTPIRGNPTGAGLFRYDNDAAPGSEFVFELNPTVDWPPVDPSLADPIQCDFQLPGSLEEPSLLTWGTSTNGLAEYLGTNFSGGMEGNIIAAGFNGQLLRMELSEDGTQVLNGTEVLAQGFGILPLDVTTPGPAGANALLGTIWIAVLGSGTIAVLEPEDFDGGGGTCLGLYNPTLDEDGDGYSNTDEIDNGTNPCSGASTPPDADGDFVSDSNDTDDDNDGFEDGNDAFPIDGLDGFSQPTPISFDLFNGKGYGFFDLGFTGVMVNDGEDYLDRYDPDNMIAGGTAGLFTIANVGPGTAYGNANSQTDALHFGIYVDQFMGPFEVQALLTGPFFGGTPTADQSHGIYIGTGDQDNYLKLAVHANWGTGGIEVVEERDGLVMATSGVVSAPEIASATGVELFLEVNPVTGLAQPYYRVSGGTKTAVGLPIQIGGALLDRISGQQAVAIGFMASAGSGPSFAATWDNIDIARTPHSTAAIFDITPPQNTINASTYGSGSFTIENLSTGGETLSEARIDFADAVFPDMVFDPDGTAGDVVGKGFTVDSTTPVGYLSATFTKPHNGVDGDDGYDQVVIEFNDFDPGESFSFSADVDPTTIKGSAQPGPSDSGSVSGLELVGSVAEFEFSDNSRRRTAIAHTPASIKGGAGHYRFEGPSTPRISIQGATSPALLSSASQTVELSGPPGASVALSIFEGALYTDGVAGGGYDIDPFEANTAVLIQEFSVILDADGRAQFPVVLSQSVTEGGYNYFNAVIRAVDGATGGVAEFITQLGSNGGIPTAPPNLIATTLSTTQIQLSWDASTDDIGVTGYEVSRDGVFVTTVATPGYLDSNLSPDTTYSYEVVALDGAGNQSPASTTSATTLSGGGGELRVNAGGNDYVDGAGNFWAADFGFNTGVTFSTSNPIAGTTDDTIYQTERWDRGQDPELIYEIAVVNGTYQLNLHFAEIYSGVTASGQRVFDVLVEGQLVFDDLDIFDEVGGYAALIKAMPSVTVTDGSLTIELLHVTQNPKISGIEVIPSGGGGDTTPPSQPGSLSGTAVDATTVDLTWTLSTDDVGVTGYEVSRDGTVLATVTTLSYTDTTAVADSTNNYSVVALDAAANRSTAATTSVVTPPAGDTTPPSQPGSLSGTAVDATTVDLTWTLSTDDVGVTGYEVSRDGTVLATVTTLSYTDTTAVADSTNNYSVVALDAAANRSTAATTSVVTPPAADTTPPSQPGSLSGTAVDATTVDLTWTLSTDDVGVTGYEVSRDGTVLATVTTLSYTDTTAVADSTNNYSVVALDAAANRSTAATTSVVTPPAADTTPPSQPGSLSGTAVDPTTVDLTWTVSTDDVGVTGYEVSRDGTVLATVTTLSYTDTTAVADSTNNYSVVALDAAANRSTAATTSVVTPPVADDTENPSVPTDLTGTPLSSTQIQLTWTASTDNVGVTGYEVSRDGVIVTTVATPGYLDSNLSPDTTYSYEVVALDGAGNQSPASTTSATTLSGGGGELRVNAGGNDYVDGAGNFWAADFGFNTGVTFSTSNPIAGTTDDTIYQTERWDRGQDPELIYEIAVVNGTYQLNLHFAEIYSGVTASGQRVFDVLVEGQLVFDDLDIFDEVGGYAALIKAMPSVTVTDGSLTIELLHVTQNPKISGIEVIPSGGGGDTTPPSQPGSLSGTAVDATTVDLTWTLSTDDVGVTGYEVSRDGTVLATVTTLSYTDTTAVADSTNNYSVVALDAAANRSTAATTSVVTPPAGDTTPPSQPGSLSGTAVDPTTVDLTWTLSTDDVGVTGYEVSRGGTVLATVTTLSYTDTTAVADSTNNYSVVALDAAANRSTAATTSVVTPPAGDTTPPSQPGSLSGTAVDATTVDLTWTLSTDDVGVTGYEVSRGGTVLATVTTLSYTDTTAVADSTNNYSVVALDAAANRSTAATTSVVTPPAADTTPPSQPGSLSGTAVDPTTVDLTWTLSTDDVGVTGYEVSRDGTVLATVTTLSYTDTTAVADSTNNYSVVALDAAANRSTAATTSVVTPPAGDTTPPSQPGSLSGTAVDPTTVDLTWTLSTDDVGVTGYEVSRGGTVLATVTTLSYTDTTAVADSTNNYSVVALDAAANRSTAATTSVVTPPAADTTPPSQPGSLSGTAVDPTTVDLTWTLSTDDVGVTGYEVSRDGTVLATVTTLSYTDTTAVADSTNNYSVVALDAAANRSTAATTSVVTPPVADDTENPSVPTDLTGTPLSSTQIQLTWTASTDNVGVTGYEVSRDGVIVTTVATPGYLDSNLSPDTTYSYEVVALDGAGNQSPASTTTATTLSAAGGTEIRINTGSGSYVDTAGQSWSADSGFNTGVTYSTSNAIAGTTDDTIYQTERWDRGQDPELIYEIAVVNGTYQLNLHFAEIYFGITAPGQRVFDVLVEGQLVFDDLDIFDEVGGYAALIKAIPSVNVTDGSLTIELLHVTQHPKISGIEVISQ